MDGRGSDSVGGAAEGGSKAEAEGILAMLPKAGRFTLCLSRRTLLKLAAVAGLAIPNPQGLAELASQRRAGPGIAVAPSVISRRALVGLPRAGAITIGARPQADPAAPQAPDLEGDAPISYTLHYIRPDDMLNLRFDFVNMVPRKTEPATVFDPYSFFGHVDTTGSLNSFVIVTFDQQHIAEECFQEATPPAPPLAPPDPPAVNAAVARPSRLAFKVPLNTTIPYSPTGLLNWIKWQPSVVPAAKPPHWYVPAGSDIRPPIVLPLNAQTALEIPFGLVLSPHENSAWAHATGAVLHNGRYELWHTRLGAYNAGYPPLVGPFANENDADNRTVRAIWSFGFNLLAPPTVLNYPMGFNLLPNAKDRYDIVRNSADYANYGSGTTFRPEAIAVDRLMLSALGGWLSARGEWAVRAPAITGVAGSSADVSLWHHKAMMGRDQYVKIVREGYLFPFGHRAAQIEVVERKIQPIPSGTFAGEPVAYLRKRTWVVVKEPTRTYPGFDTKQGRQFPFRVVTLSPRSTPDLANPTQWPSVIAQAPGCFWPAMGSDAAATYFQFKVQAVDGLGRQVEFSAPLIFVLDSVNDSADSDTPATTSLIEQVRNDYLGPQRASLRRRELHGQTFALADPVDVEGRNRVCLPVTAVTFGADILNAPSFNPNAGTPSFYPTLGQAEVNLTAIEQIVGQGAPAAIQFEPGYVNSGYGNGGVWATLAGGPLAVQYYGKTDQVGGLMKPDMSVTALSRTLGPVGGDAASLAAGTFNPASFFPTTKLLGGVSLIDIIDTITGTDLSTMGARVPQMHSWTVYETAGDPTTKPIEIHTQYHWAPTVHGGGAFISNGAALDINTHMINRLGTGESDFTVDGTLTNFALDIFVLRLDFGRLSFSAAKGKKSDIKVQIGSVGFGDPLTFINALRPFMLWGGSANGQTSALAATGGPSIEISSYDIRASLTLGLPMIAVGAFTMQNMSITAGVTIPFNGDPVRARFSFCSRENPFLVTVSLFGGGGFVGVDVGPDGVERLEASIEFGGAFAINLGVASGGVYVMAGVYFQMQLSDNSCQLTGYVRLGGELDVLGLISISIEFYLSLNYETSSGDLWGQASVTVEVEVLFFSKSVSMSVERRFAGSKNSLLATAGADGEVGAALADLAAPALTFSSLIPTVQAWAEYCDAFAGPLYQVNMPILIRQ